MKNTTLAIIKPDAVSKGFSGEIISMIEDAGFKLKAVKMTRITPEKAGVFYGMHKEKKFFSDLVQYMCSGPVIVMLLEKENAIEEYRKLIGATDPKEADEGTIRRLFAESKQVNAVHGSDSEESVLLESALMFGFGEIV